MGNKHLYHQALICEYGHLISSDYVPDPAILFCPHCGKPCISACPTCGKPIRGDCYERVPVYGACYSTPVFGSDVGFPSPKGFTARTITSGFIPSYCYHCGSPYPWVESLIREASDIVDLMDELTEEQKSALKECFPSLISDMPSTPRHSLIAARILQSVSAIAMTALQNLLAEHLTAFALSLLGWKSH